jgi:hypothetical protein
MPFAAQDDLDRARRRPVGDRLLIYLDQSSLSGMVRKPDAFREVLLHGAQTGRLICARSPAHHDESVLAQQHT